MARSIVNVERHLERALSRWPKDRLRPEMQLQDVLRKRLANTGDRQLTKDEGAQVNALYSLLENRYSKKYRLSPLFMKPKSQPTYYDDLIKELDEAPDRSWWERAKKRMSNIVRF